MIEKGEKIVKKKNWENKVMKEEKNLINLKDIEKVNQVIKKFIHILKKITINVILKIQTYFGMAFSGWQNQKHFSMLIKYSLKLRNYFKRRRINKNQLIFNSNNWRYKAWFRSKRGWNKKIYCRKIITTWWANKWYR